MRVRCQYWVVSARQRFVFGDVVAKQQLKMTPSNAGGSSAFPEPHDVLTCDRWCCHHSLPFVHLTVTSEETLRKCECIHRDYKQLVSPAFLLPTTFTPVL